MARNNENDQSFREHLPQQTVSTLREWAREPDLLVRFIVNPEADPLEGLGRLEEPPQSPKSIVSSLAPLPSAISGASTDRTQGTNYSESILTSPPISSVPELSRTETDSSLPSDGLDLSEPIPISGAQLLVPDGVEPLEDASSDAPIYQCCFWFLKCDYESHNEEEWKTHCMSHFRGNFPPRKAECPLCDTQFLQSDESWARKMDHLADHHRAGLTNATARPDFNLFKYLWSQRIIHVSDYQELNGNWSLQKPPKPWVERNGERSRRGERRGPPPQPSL